MSRRALPAVVLPLLVAVMLSPASLSVPALRADNACPAHGESVTVPAGTVITWTCSVPPGTPTVRWSYRDSSAGSHGSYADIAGATGTTYTFTASVADDGTQFRAYYRDANGGFVPILLVTLTVTSDVPLVADMDGDGRSDLIVWRPNTGTWYWLLSSTGYAPQFARSLQFGSKAMDDVPLVGDLDGDGKGDLVIYRRSTGDWYWLTSSTNYSYAAMRRQNWGAYGLNDHPLLGDVDGDRRSDLIIWRGSWRTPDQGGTFGWLASSSDYSPAASGGVDLGSLYLDDFPIVGDIDGDGRVEFCVWRVGDGVWRWLTRVSAYSQGGSLQWGSANYRDARFFADMDGDGRADVLVWRRLTGTWHWVTSSTQYSYAQQRVLQWGSQDFGDVPVIGDFDGDGVADPAVWRPTNGTWYWLRSSTGWSYAGAQSVQWGSALQ